MSLQETFDINHYYCNHFIVHIVHHSLLTLEGFTKFRKKLIKVSQKRGKIMCLYKCVDIIIFYYI